MASVWRNALFNNNRMKLGTFCTNTVNATTLAPEMTLPSWDACIEAARMADTAGFEAITPIARWKGYVDNDPEHVSHQIMEAFTFAAAIAQATTYSTVFATTHAPTIHPVAIAKMAATIDHISGGRFALNVVGGWNRREFDMFGIDLLGHDERYVYLAEWVQLLKRLWTGEEFDHHSHYFKMKAALARPRPVQQGGIPIMNAGTSEMGMRFAAKHSDIGFCMPIGDDIRGWAPQVQNFKKIAREEFGREIQIWTNASVVQRSNRAEALEFRSYCVEEMLDHKALDSLIATMVRENGWDDDDRRIGFMRARMSGGSGFPLLGSANDIAEQLGLMADAGIDGVLMTWIDYLDGIRKFADNVLPLLEEAGLRQPWSRSSIPS